MYDQQHDDVGVGKRTRDPNIQSRMWSTMACEADAAELSLRSLSTTAPRFCTVGITGLPSR